MNCPRCGIPSSEGKKYCADCGTPLDPELIRVEELVERRINQAIDAKFKDQRLVTIETSEAIANRFYLWAKLFAFFTGIPLALILLILSIGGIRTYSDLRNMINGIEAQVKPRVEQAKASADEAQSESEEAQREAEQAKRTVATVTTQVNRDVGSAATIAKDVQGLSTRMSELEKKTSDQIDESSKTVDARVSDLNVKIDAAVRDIGEQEKKLDSTDAIVKNIFSKGTVEYVPTNGNSSRVVVLPFGKGAAVYMLLGAAPIPQTLEMKWRVASQPRGSYFVLNNNAVLFIWGDPLENLKQNPLEVNYVPDPTMTTEPFKTLSVRDNHVFADTYQLPDVSPQPSK
jgi:F0F1-type ATP synthase membrane subunit b/b'